MENCNITLSAVDFPTKINDDKSIRFQKIEEMQENMKKGKLLLLSKQFSITNNITIKNQKKMNANLDVCREKQAIQRKRREALPNISHKRYHY